MNENILPAIIVDWIKRIDNQKERIDIRENTAQMLHIVATHAEAAIQRFEKEKAKGLFRK